MSHSLSTGSSPLSPDDAPAPSGARRFPRATVILVALAAATVTAAGLSSIRGILAPVLLTLVLTICAHPVRTGLERRGVPHGLATGSVILVVFVLLAGFTYTVIIAFAQFATMLPQYSQQLSEIGATISSWLQSIGIGAAQVQEMVSSFDPSNILSFFTGVLGSVFSITGALVIVLTMLILMSADAVYVPTIMRQLSTRKPQLVAAIGEYAKNVRRYMVVTTVLGVAQGVLNALALWIMQVPAALLWGILAFLCSFIPNIGYFFAIIPPLVFGFLVGGWPTVIAVVIVYGIINAVVQSIIQPRVVGNAVSLSQTITFFSVLFWAVVIGPIGAILAVPLTLLARTVLIDADPNARWWRPAIGDTTETRTIMKEDDAAAKRARKAQQARRKAAK
ncbi:AI-2E family transporter [Compostimonas suwonensis]|uniref:Putative PurR-regulated permease PerM n=1 Tax=Compostimonas suwonensis TaxID=1048394 RepID=A0A2M9BVQ3_9MICO|nr:AI-2E family transporter [Compostimonas suwonensis]PJJ62021.1 putative PurR-regulated permease PerM [Compostimonas suwonensis]